MPPNTLNRKQLKERTARALSVSGARGARAQKKTCSTCHKAMVNLNIHMLIHNAVVISTCKFKDCNKVFRRPDLLQKHLNRGHNLKVRPTAV